MVHQPAVPQPRTASAGRAYLDVPYAEKDAAKALGARWDPNARRWYDPRPPSAGLDRWAGRPDVPELLPGEDRTFGSGLFVDLVPRSCWFTNVRSCVTEQDWERLRRPILRRAAHRCEACRDGEDRAAARWLEVHERWSYNNDTGVQTLRRLICLCSPCHLVTHLGYANVTGRTEEALAHLRRVNGWDAGKTYGHVYAAENLWIDRSARTWSLDLTMLTGAGIAVRRPESASERPAAAERALQAATMSVLAARPAPSPSAATRPSATSTPPAVDQPRGGLWSRLTGRGRA